MLTARDTIAFVKRHGIVLESARGQVPNLAEAVAGDQIHGGWWSHAKGRNIFAATRAVRNSPNVLVCRLLGGKVTYIHRRLWPAFIRLSDKLNKNLLASIREKHTASGAHRVVTIPFRKWVSKETQEAAERLSESQALSELGEEVVMALGFKKSRGKRKR